MNRQTKFDRYAMPTPGEIFDAIEHSKVFSTLDLRSGYHQLPIREVNKEKTTFWGINEHGKDRLYQCEFLPFGLKNAPAEFQKVMDKILAGLDFARCYIDDIIVFSANADEHQRHLQLVFERLRSHWVEVAPKKMSILPHSS